MILRFSCSFLGTHTHCTHGGNGGSLTFSMFLQHFSSNIKPSIDHSVIHSLTTRVVSVNIQLMIAATSARKGIARKLRWSARAS